MNISDISIGMKVKVIRKITKQIGWSNHWVYPMDAYINSNKEYTISKIDLHYGIYLTEIPDLGWPSNALEPVQQLSKDELIKKRIHNLWNNSNWVKKHPDQAYA